MQANGLDHQRIANDGLMEIHKKLGIPLAGTNDCHYLKKEDSRPHELMLCLQTGKTLSDPNRMKFDTDQLYVKSTEEIAPAFAEFPGGRHKHLPRSPITATSNSRSTRRYLPQYQGPGRVHARILCRTTGDRRTEGAARRNGPAPSPSAVYEQRLREEV